MCNYSVKISNKEFEQIKLTLIDLLEKSYQKGFFEWKDVVSYFNETHKIKNWLKVRVVINWLEQNNAIKKDSNIHIEKYNII